jgi:hypothetical protein
MKRLRPSTWRILVAVAAAGLLPAVALIVWPSSGNSAHGALGQNKWQLLAKAQPDECFNGMGNPYPAGPPCAEGQPKVNQAYVWGMTKADDNLWFGTGANVNCIVAGHSLGDVTPELTDDWVCEFGESQFAKDNGLPAGIGDFRPPEAFSYDTATNSLTDRTQEITDASDADNTMLDNTFGFRAAGSLNGVAFLAGPSSGGAINMFAFDTDTGAYLGSHSFAAYNNIRHFGVVNGVLYAGVANASGSSTGTSTGGAVLRWTGDKSNPFQFENVGNITDEVASLTTYKGRVAISTWPSGTAGDGGDNHAGIWVSPQTGDEGLTTDDADSWTEVWKASDYEPDPLISQTYGGGDLVTYRGDLYWGTMTIPMRGTEVIANAYPPANDQQSKADLYLGQRSITIWRASNLLTDKSKTELLYGSDKLPAYDPNKNDGAGGWSMQSTGWTPKYGKSGFGNFFNNYTWTMGVAGGKLYIGTMDWQLLKNDLATNEAKQLGMKDTSKKALSNVIPATKGNSNSQGADLWEFSSNHSKAKLVSDDGMGNYLNYGIRTMVPDGNTMYMGTANPMNLDTSTTDNKPEGGWELIKFNAGMG